MKSRLITAAIALPVLIASIIFPPLKLLFVVIAAAAVVVALYEFWFLAKRVGAKPDVVVADIRTPPGLADDGVRAAQEIRRRYPGTGVLLLSQYVEPAYARDLLETGEEGVGYLLKDRVADMDGFRDAVRRVAAGETVLDPELHLEGR